MKQVYISYSHSNRDFAEPLAHDLMNAGFDVWIDFLRFTPGTPREDMLQSMLAREAFVVCLSPAALESKWVRSEVELAKKNNKLIIPVMVESCWEALAQDELLGWLNDIYILSIEKLTYSQIFPQLVRALAGLPRLFISYRRQDSADAVGRITDRLIARFGKEAIFQDVDYIAPGINFKKRLESTINQSRVVLVMIGDQWLNIKDEYGRKRLDLAVDFVRIEIESALKRNIHIIPVLLNGVRMPEPSELPDSISQLAYYQAVVVRHDPDFSRDVLHLVKAIEQYIPPK